MSEATVIVADQQYVVPPGERFTFGRSRECTACLDPEDAAISRHAGSLSWQHGVWWLTNESRSYPLRVIDDVGLPSALLPGRRIAVEVDSRVTVRGSRRDHTLRITAPATATAGDDDAGPPAGTPTAVGQTVLIKPEDRLAMLALFDSYLLDPPHYKERPRTYASAAKRLGWEKTTLVKRIEHLRERLTKAGVPQLTGESALQHLAEYALARRLITKEDLPLLYGEGRVPGQS